MPLLGWDQGAPKLARGQEAAQGPRGSQSPPSAPQPQLTLKGCVHSSLKPTSASPAPARLRGNPGWQGRAGGPRGEPGVLTPMLILSQHCPSWALSPVTACSPKLKVPGAGAAVGRLVQAGGSQLQEGARGRGSSQSPCRDCPLSELQGTGPGSRQAQGLEGLVLS